MSFQVPVIENAVARAGRNRGEVMAGIAFCSVNLIWDLAGAKIVTWELHKKEESVRDPATKIRMTFITILTTI